MGLFRRKEPPPPTTSGSRQFWEWWAAEGAATVGAAIAEARVPEVVDELSTRVKAIHPALAWEVGPGQSSAHRLTVTAEGDPQGRGSARRWLRRAPESDATWEYADLRAAVPDVLGMELSLDGQTIAAAATQVAWTRRRNHLDVALHHPSYAGLGDAARTQATFLLLDAALGERDTTLWLGRISPAVHAVAGEQRGDLSQLRAAVAALRDELTDDDGGPTWVVMSGENPLGRTLATAMVPLHPLMAPHLDSRLSVTVQYADVGPDGFPSPTGLQALRQLEEAISARLGDAGMLVAHETTQGKRTLHYYLDSATTAADHAKAVAGGWRQGKVSFQLVSDPLWGAVSHMRT